MRVLFVCTQFPCPPFSGMRRKILTFIKYLHKKGDEIYLFSLAPPEREFENKYFKEVVVAKDNGYFKKCIRTIRYLFKKPIQISIYADYENIKFLKKYIKKIKPHAIFIDYIRSADFGIALNLPKIINYDDPQSLKFKRMKRFLNEIRNPFGEGINFFPDFIKRIISLPVIKKIILTHEIHTLARYEKWVSKYYPVILTNSAEDAGYLRKNGVKNIDFLPPLIDKEYYLKVTRKPKDGIITFVGKMDYPPNPHAVEYFVREIMPEIERNYKRHFEFRVIGVNTPSWIFEFSKMNDKVKVIGEVEDIRPFLSESTVFVAPLKFGTGIKVKILEAMALGVPVVTTSIGVQGMNVKNGVHLFVEDEPEEFARSVIKLLNDGNLRRKIALAAKKYVFEEFDAEKYVKNIREYLKGNQK